MQALIEQSETENEPTQEELDAWADEEFALLQEMEDGRLVMESAAAGIW